MREAQLLAAPVHRSLDEPEVDEARQRVVVERVDDVGHDDRLVEPQPEKEELPGVCRVVDRLDFPRRRLTGRASASR